MKLKSFLLATTVFVLSTSVNAVTVYTGGNFTMLDPSGQLFAGTNDVGWVFDETMTNTTANGTAFNGNMTSNQLFFGAIWTTHDVRIFEEGSYSFDSTCTSSQIQSGISNCNGSPPGNIAMEVGAGQLGAHMLFDYNGTIDTDIAIVWDQNSLWSDADGSSSSVNNLWGGPAGDVPDPSLNWQLVSTDADGDGINGISMIDGPFPAFSANFNFGQVSTVPVPAAVWLFGSGLLGLIGLARRKANA